MSHSVQITLNADQVIKLLGAEVNIHGLESISVDGVGNITGYTLMDERKRAELWVSVPAYNMAELYRLLLAARNATVVYQPDKLAMAESAIAAKDAALDHALAWFNGKWNDLIKQWREI